MVKLNNGMYIIVFDNGYQFGKTAGVIFDNGVYPMGNVEPSLKEHSLKYERKYYKVGEGRAEITEDKVSDENARLLTMVAMQNFSEHRANVAYDPDIHANAKGYEFLTVQVLKKQGVHRYGE